MKNLIIRTLTGAVFAGSVIGSILWSPFAFAGLMLVFSILAVLEFYRMFNREGFRPQMVTGLLVCGIISLMFSLAALKVISPGFLLYLLPLLLLPFILELYRKLPAPFINIGVTLLPFFYIAIPMASLNFLFSPYQFYGEYFPAILLGFFILIWTGDTMAYLGGMALGRHKLFERISPKKTWEGSIIGAIFSFAMAWFLSLFFKEFNMWEWVGMAAVIIVFGTLGDLIESMLKRSAGVKDSGNLLPGHGGFLDRFDGVLLSAPMVFLYIHFINGNL